MTYVNTEIADKYQEFFNFMNQEYDLTLTISEMDEIVSEAQKIVKKLAIPDVMPRFSLNHEVIIYPNEKGFNKIKALISNRYLLSNEEAETWVNKRKTEDGGYKEQLWVIVSDLHDMFYNGQSYMATTWIALK